MAKSLRDQLIKSGATDASKNSGRGKKKRSPKAAKKDRAPGSMAAQDKTPNAAEIRSRQQAQRDRELNQQRQQQLAQREVAAQIRQLIERNSIDQSPSEHQQVDYNFNDSGVVRRISLPEKLHRRVSAGTIAIAILDDSYHLIARPVADKICERDASYIVVMNDDRGDQNASSKPDEDDEYAGYEVPDDLMW